MCDLQDISGTGRGGTSSVGDAKTREKGLDFLRFACGGQGDSNPVLRVLGVVVVAELLENSRQSEAEAMVCHGDGGVQHVAVVHDHEHLLGFERMLEQVRAAVGRESGWTRKATLEFADGESDGGGLECELVVAEVGVRVAAGGREGRYVGAARQVVGCRELGGDRLRSL